MNSLNANVPAVLPVGVAVDYMCTDPAFNLVGNPSNQCDGEGMYGPAPACESIPPPSK